MTYFPLFVLLAPANLLMIYEGFNKILNMEFIDKQVIYDKTLGKTSPIVSGASAGDAKDKLGLGNF